jgi:toxin HigB-1
MIKSFQHKGLENFYTTGSKAGIQAKHAPKLRRILAVLDVATKIEDVSLPGYRLHPLMGKQKGFFLSLGQRQLACYFSICRG